MPRFLYAIALFAAAAVWEVGATGTRNEPTDTLVIGAYSVVRDAFHEAILPGFARHWKEKTGRSVHFEESYSGSGAQARAIASGFDADVAILSLEGDIDLLVKAGMVNSKWRDAPHGGMITRSLVVIGYREGNPKGIHDWEDLTRSGVGVVYPDPKTSGGARWNINAIYGAGLFRASRSKPDREAARDLLARVQSNVVTMDASGRQSVATFDRGTGDAIVTYENELLLQGKIAGRPRPYAIPPSTLLIEGPAAVVDASVTRHGNRAVAEAFLEYLRSTEAQQILADFGFRPLHKDIDSSSGRPPMPEKLFTMADMGGWSKNKKEVFETGGVWDRLFTAPSLKGGKPMIPSAAAKGSLAVRAALAYLAALVALPLGVLVYQTAKSGPAAFLRALGDPIALHALALTFVTAAVMVVINVFTGTATAWVLVRYHFPGKNIVNALIDLPFAVPTVVAGVMLVALYGPASVVGTVLGEHGLAVIYQQPGIVLALLFVTFPFVVRSVQPVLLALDSAEEEAAWTLGAGAWTTFRRVTLPAIMPAILTGASLSFSRALGEFGSVVMVAGNRPMSTKTAPLYIFGEIESGHRYEAMAISVVLLAASLGSLVILNRLQQGRGLEQHVD